MLKIERLVQEAIRTFDNSWYQLECALFYRISGGDYGADKLREFVQAQYAEWPLAAVGARSVERKIFCPAYTSF